MSGPQIDVTERHDWRIEDCGCIFRLSNGALLRGCRRHDPQVAGRIVARLEQEARTYWRVFLSWRSADHDAQAQRECSACNEMRRAVLALLAIRRAGRQP